MIQIRECKSIQLTLTVTNGTYSIGDAVGGLLTFPAATLNKGGHSMVTSVKLAGVSAIAYNLWFLTGNIATPAADNAAFTIVAADEELFTGHVAIPAANYVAAASAFNVCTVPNAGLMVHTSSSRNILYGYLVATATTTPGTTTLYLTVDFEYRD